MKQALMVVVVLAMVLGALLLGCEPMDGNGTGEKTTREKLLGAWEIVEGGLSGRYTLNADGTLVLSATFDGRTITGDGGWFVNDADVLTYTFLLPGQPTVTRVRQITVLTDRRLCMMDAEPQEGIHPKTECWTRA